MQIGSSQPVPVQFGKMTLRQKILLGVAGVGLLGAGGVATDTISIGGKDNEPKVLCESKGPGPIEVGGSKPTTVKLDCDKD